MEQTPKAVLHQRLLCCSWGESRRLLEQWYHIVELFATKQSAKPQDKLAALVAVAQQVFTRLGAHSLPRRCLMIPAFSCLDCAALSRHTLPRHEVGCNANGIARSPYRQSLPRGQNALTVYFVDAAPHLVRCRTALNPFLPCSQDEDDNQFPPSPPPLPPHLSADRHTSRCFPVLTRQNGTGNRSQVSPPNKVPAENAYYYPQSLEHTALVI